MDAIDAALVELECVGDRLRLHTLAFTMVPLASALRARIVTLLPPYRGSTAEVCALNVAIGEAFAEAALRVARQAGVAIESVDLIASHGQTVYHQVAAGVERSTLQLGTPAVIAERTGRTVVADFRPRDIAAGGQGAPLVPYLDLLLFRHPRRARAVQNIGGMGNVTYLPPAGSAAGDWRLEARNNEPASSFQPPAAHRSVVAFDTGPGTILIDEAVQRLTDGRLAYDHDGRIAASGRIDEELLARALAMAEKLAQAPTAAIGRIKELLEASATNDYGGQLELERERQIQSGLTKDFKEGVAAFIEKRPAKFVGG